MLPRSVRRRCPAIIFAASRTARVPGRITFLIVSISTIRGIRGPGVPAGTKCANMCCVWLIQPNNINDNQRGNLSDSVRARCLVEVKTYGVSPRKLLKTISEKIEIKIIVLPGLLVPRRVLNSLWSVDISVDHKNDHRDGMAQNE